jgi:hypothetical protein
VLNFVAARRNCSEVEIRKMDVDFVSRAIGDLYIENVLVVVRCECRVQPDVGDWSTDHSPRVASLTAARSHVRTCDVIHSNQMLRKMRAGRHAFVKNCKDALFLRSSAFPLPRSYDSCLPSCAQASSHKDKASRYDYPP